MNLEALLSARLAPALAEVARAAVDPAVRRSRHADFQSGAVLSLAGRLGRSPRDVAREVAGRSDLAGLAQVEVSGPGFLNLTVADELIASAVNALAADARLGVPPAAQPRTVVVDYSAPNIAKELTVGHLRSMVIGDSLARTLAWLGHDVVRANHVGDWGTAFGMLIEHLLDSHSTGAPQLGDLTGFYQAARAKFDADEEFRSRSRLRVVRLQAGDERTLRLWRAYVAESRRYLLAAYERLGVTLTEADFAGESTYNDALPAVVDELVAKGLLIESDGALCAFPAGFTGRDGEPLPLIVRKSDGGFGYAATDLAALRHRVRVLGATRLLYVVGAPQRTHFEMVYAVAAAAGWLPDGVTAEHVAFGSILGADGKMFRTRSGDSVKLAELLDEAVVRASSLGTCPEVAAAVGVGAVKYADLAGDRRNDYVFDWDRMLALTGNTGPYLQYAYARICSVLERAGDPAGAVTICHPAERALALELLAFEPVVRSVGETLEPHRLAGYLYGLASLFSGFYENCPVLKAPDDVRASRLALCVLTGRTLRQGLDLLGMAAPTSL
ncbi:arginine--tRNA ligase [Couchioplanes caeruleus]|uniref:Arginine--tRNA ligase n=2 Tax=Couchioplanes caeruleus TaxID=56438 RepID=A0A1K0GMW9_9ACTN|nr:arginine--tRNA ligase [Couchioplanes caeruleus]OJF12420.1 arginine--tRNA ligase [Couchioplanes caeruleus subsp. caeruleus]